MHSTDRQTDGQTDGLTELIQEAQLMLTNPRERCQQIGCDFLLVFCRSLSLRHAVFESLKVIPFDGVVTVSLVLCSNFILKTQYQRVTDRQTDRHRMTA